MMQRLFALWFLCAPFVLPAQDNTGVSSERLLPMLVLKANASTLLNPFKPALAATVDVRLSRRFTLDAGVGRILGSSTFANHRGERYQGGRYRAGIKYYMDFGKVGGYYIGFEGKYNSVEHRYWRDVFRQGRQYEETLLVDRRVLTQGLALRIGGQFFFGARKRFVLEPYAGWGLVRHDVSVRTPPDAELLFRGFEWFSLELPEGRSGGLDMLLGIHIGYALW